MQFTTNKIHLGKVPSFDEIVAKVRGEKIASANTEVVKTASVKIAEQDEAPSSGQLDVEPLHQEGESTNQDSVAGGKDNEDSAATAKKTNPDDEGKDSGQPAAEAKLTNDPKVDKDAETEEKVEKEAGKIPGVPDGTGPRKDTPGCPFTKDDDDKDDDEDKDKDDKDDDKDEDKEAKIEVAIEKEAGKVPGVPDGTGPGKDSPECPFNKDDKKDKDEKEDEKDCTLSASSKGLVKIANLPAAEKNRLKEYWKNIYPADYVDAMVEDL